MPWCLFFNTHQRRFSAIVFSFAWFLVFPYLKLPRLCQKSYNRLSNLAFCYKNRTTAEHVNNWKHTTFSPITERIYHLLSLQPPSKRFPPNVSPQIKTKYQTLVLRSSYFYSWICWIAVLDRVFLYIRCCWNQYIQRQ